MNKKTSTNELSYAQNTKPLDTSPLISSDLVKQIERIVVKLLYYTHGVDNTCLVLLSAMVSRIEPTEQDKKNVNVHQVFSGEIETGLQVLLWLTTRFHQCVQMVPHDWDVEVPPLNTKHPERRD